MTAPTAPEWQPGDPLMPDNGLNGGISTVTLTPAERATIRDEGGPTPPADDASECQPCAVKHPRNGCADVGCSHNCEDWTSRNAPAASTDASEGLSEAEREHDPRCYQRTGVPDDMPANICDCGVLRAIDEAESLANLFAKHKPVIGRFSTLNAVVGCQCMDRVFVAGRENYQDHLATIVAARESAAATRARAEGAAEALREAAEVLNREGLSFKPGGWGSNPADQQTIDAMAKAVDWLRDRAASIARGDAAPDAG